MSSSLPIDALQKVLAAVEEAGVPKERLAAEANLRLEQGIADIPFEKLAAAYEAAARLTGDGAFGLRLGEKTTPRMYGLLGYVVANSRTVEEALVSLSRYQPLWSRGAGFEFIRQGKRVRLRYWQSGNLPAEQRRQESEHMLSALLTFLRAATGTRIIPAEVRFEHGAPADQLHHRRIFGSRIRFGAAATELVLSEDLLHMPHPEADKQLASVLKRQAELELGYQLSEEPLLQSLQAAVGAAVLGGGETTLKSIGEAVGLGPRTLQRRLRQEGLTFRRLVEEARAAVADRLLRDQTLSLAEIAFRLGYSQTSAFHRAFRRRSGDTPRQARAALMAART